MTPAPMTFQEIQLHSGGCGWQIRDLAAMLAIDHPCDMAGPLGDYEADDYKRLGEDLGAIERVLELVAQTPNAYVNREALDAMEVKVHRARAILAEEWVMDLLKTSDVVLGREIIPF